MALSWKDVIAEVQDRWDTHVADPYGVQTQYPNDATFKVDKSTLGTFDCWARFRVRPVGMVCIENSSNPLYRMSGIAIAELLTPVNLGTENLYLLVAQIVNAFLDLDDLSVTYEAPSPESELREEEWWRVDVHIPFHADRFYN
jgi:hypothetical protein